MPHRTIRPKLFMCSRAASRCAPPTFSEAVWKQSLYKRRPYVICGARLRTDILDNRSLAMLLEISKGLIYQTLVSGQPLSVGYYDKTARLWDLTTNPPTQIQAFPKAQNELLWATLSPDGQAMASVGRAQVVEVYSTHDAQLLHRLVGHEDTIYRAIFSPDGHQLATVSSDATLRLW